MVSVPNYPWLIFCARFPPPVAQQAQPHQASAQKQHGGRCGNKFIYQVAAENFVVRNGERTWGVRSYCSAEGEVETA